MRKTILLFILLLSSIGFCQYNNIIASQMSTKFIQADTYIGNDAVGFEYFTKNNTLFKFNGNAKFQYKNIYMGKISRVDLQNPLRILLFYENFNTIIALDSQLNEIEKINFNENNPNLIVAAMGIAARNKYWIFDQTTQQLNLYDLKKKSLQPIGVPLNSSIKNYASTYNLFFWVDQENKFYLCDIFGKISEIATLPDYDAIYLTDESVLAYQKDEKLYFYDLQRKVSITIENVQKTFLSYTYKNQNLAIFTTEGITNYKINLP
ncbi:hypothetical protein [Flavobacterium sp. H122]|uniref:hypothetical protein n=1 Tax=Flavobacterium sp. H122 TaxID=2529860 RepID=UPI0010A9EA64|nr:hypothetical protein [Flavobacterium sp. H122]